MFKLLKNNKGMTITEIITALAVLGIISIPLMAVFSNSVLLTKMTGNQLEINAVMQIAKADVVQSVKNDVRLCDFSDPDKEIYLNPSRPTPDAIYAHVGNETAAFLELGTGNLTEKYKYKVRYEDMGAPDIVRLTIKLYTAQEKFLSELKIEVSSRDFQ
ncbi:hypothetical protein CLHUN_31690 [Ruminiclostridium hungatei]|uniref:Prepilin-type N-terminal cleavage/methylation domain-containing protein n=1 Tax=Ruminiclostridium hungatei TaxID=48256 RepID=A0A1V4SHT4_RUMHU|nr:prepilin-type N-terminal cleavage/methylation domain-containing protein [Ruminiclostridium hungatei]OPX43025.1 hypothetical protein CLHUN_31690 [Ruminiclostridium hungatei]